MRLNQFLARAGVSSRRGGDDLIRQGAVSVNGAGVTDMGRQVDPAKDSIKVNGKRVTLKEFHYYLYYKPDGVMCTLEDPEDRPNLGDMVRRLGAGRLFPVGRLDFHTEGLLLLTNDGALAQKLLHPKFQVARIYQAKVQGILTPEEFERLGKGLRLEDGWASAEAKPMEKLETNSYVQLIVREGRNRLVRRLMEAMGHPVVKLKRVGFGPLKLHPMKPGDVRELEPRELKDLWRSTGVANPAPRKPRKPGFKNKKRLTRSPRQGGAQ